MGQRLEEDLMARTGGRMYWPGFQLETQDNGELIRSDMPVADEGWAYVDKEGHGHFWKNGYPTLKKVYSGCDMGHGDDCKGALSYECPTCGERITPDTRIEADRWVPGPITYTLSMTGPITKVWRFGEDRWRTLNDMMQAAIEDALQDENLIETRYGL